MNGYKEAVDDEQLINQIQAGVESSSGDWLNSSDLSRERLKSTYEYAGVPFETPAPFHFVSTEKVQYVIRVYGYGILAKQFPVAFYISGLKDSPC